MTIVLLRDCSHISNVVKQNCVIKCVKSYKDIKAERNKHSFLNAYSLTM